MRRATAVPLLGAAGVAVFTGVLGCAAPRAGADAGPDGEQAPQTIAGTVAGWEPRPGLLDLHVDREGGRVLAHLPAPRGRRGEIGRYLHTVGLRTGLGSNPVGLDRGRWREARLVVLRRTGPRVVLEQPNLRYRAVTGAPAERLATEESFATSILWAAEAERIDEDGTALVDLTSLVVRDAYGVAAALKSSGQGTFRLEPSRSHVDVDAALAFPDNVELEATLTFTSDDPGPEVAATAPDPSAVTLVQHLGLVRLPDDGYRPRAHDPRAGAFALGFADYAAPLDEPIERRLAVRHRLQRSDPAVPGSPVGRPIVYHVDRGAPEPVRSALIEGARWWEEAFAEAGFPGAFRVELLPEGVHPLDVRYHVIQWVHRATRGWSYGRTLVDPRTGEIVKAHVSLGSLRIRQDTLLFEGLLGTGETGRGTPGDPIELALARIRQLAAHEVGHTLGLAHNFAGSTIAFNGSVMDYPAPRIRLDEMGRLDATDAYGAGVGPWDRHAIRWLYHEVAPGEDEAAALEAVLAAGREAGFVYLSDRDARPAGAADPRGSLWDVGPDPVDGLERSLAVRRRALEDFGTDRVAPGEPLAALEEVFATVYFHHRYQLEAAAKAVGGVLVDHTVRGEGRTPLRPVDGATQRRALQAVLGTLDPAVLDVPDAVLSLLAPRPPGWSTSSEQLAGRAGAVADPLAAAGAAAGLAARLLLQRERCARLVDQHRRVPDLPGLDEVLDALRDVIRPRPGEPAHGAALRDEAAQAVFEAAAALVADERAAPAVRAATATWLPVLAGPEDAGDAGTAWRRRAAERLLERPVDAAPPAGDPVPLPPGPPIGLGPAVGGGCSLPP